MFSKQDLNKNQDQDPPANFGQRKKNREKKSATLVLEEKGRDWKKEEGSRWFQGASLGFQPCLVHFLVY